MKNFCGCFTGAVFSRSAACPPEAEIVTNDEKNEPIGNLLPYYLLD